MFRTDEQAVAHSQLSAFRQWCETRTGQNLPDHAAMDRFSVEEFRSFWRLFLEWCDLPREGAVDPVCVGDVCETPSSFPGSPSQLLLECLLAGSPDQPVLTAVTPAAAATGSRVAHCAWRSPGSRWRCAASVCSRAIGSSPSRATARRRWSPPWRRRHRGRVRELRAGHGRPARSFHASGPSRPVVLVASLRGRRGDEGAPFGSSRSRRRIGVG